MYTLDDLANARATLQRLSDAFDRYTGNNPNKGQADIKAACRQVRAIEQHLKRSGVIPLTEREKVEAELDRAFPNARSKQVVEHNGRRYQRWFNPLEWSRSRKSVPQWERGWADVTDDLATE